MNGRRSTNKRVKKTQDHRRDDQETKKEKVRKGNAGNGHRRGRKEAEEKEVEGRWRRRRTRRIGATKTNADVVVKWTYEN